MGFCRAMAKKYVIGISVVVMIVALIILSISSYVISQVGDELKEVNLNSPAATSLAFSIFMLVFGVLGCVGASKNIKVLLILYSTGTMFFTFIIVGFGVVVLVQSGELDNIADLKEPSTQVENDIQTFVLAVFDVCCEEGNREDLLCANNDNVQPCVAADNVDFFNNIVNFLDNGDSNAATCQLLQGVEVDDGTPLINAEAIGTNDVCGEGAGEFVSEATGFLEENFKIVGIANIVTGVILLLLLMFSCVLIFTNDQDLGSEKVY